MNDEWFLKHSEGMPELPVRKKPCDDCAVVDGFYKEYSDNLKMCSDHVKEFSSKRWFCHNNGKVACRGNWDNVGLIAE